MSVKNYNKIKYDKPPEISPSHSVKEKYNKLENSDPSILKSMGDFFSRDKTNRFSYEPPEKDTKITRLISRPLDSTKNDDIEIYEIENQKKAKHCCIIS